MEKSQIKGTMCVFKIYEVTNNETSFISWSKLFVFFRIQKKFKFCFVNSILSIIVKTYMYVCHCMSLVTKYSMCCWCFNCKEITIKH